MRNFWTCGDRRSVSKAPASSEIRRNDAIANGRKESGKRRKTKELRETKRGRVAETAREAIQDGERTNGGNAPTRSADVPTFPFYPICGGVKGGPGAFFERRRAKSGRRGANLDWAAENDRRLAGGVRRLRRAAFDDESVFVATGRGRGAFFRFFLFFFFFFFFSLAFGFARRYTNV